MHVSRPAMTARERILTAYRCQQPDRVPIIVRGVDPYAQHMNWRGKPDPSYQPLIERVKACCDVEHIWNTARGFFLNCADFPIKSCVEEEKGWRVTYSTVETPRGPLTAISKISLNNYSHATVKHWLTEEEDVERFLSLPFSLAEPQLDDYNVAEEALGDAGYVLPHLNDPIGFVASLLGSELLAIWSVEANHLIERLLAEMHHRCLAYARTLLEGGVSPVLGTLGQEYVVPPLFSPRHFDRFVTRYDAPLTELIHDYGCLVPVHCHGSLNGVLERFADIGVDALHPVEAPPMGDVTLADAKRRVGDRICLKGNVQIGDIMLCERREIVHMVKQALREGAPGGGFILSLSATPFEWVLSQRTLDNLQAFIETGLEYGQYPLNL